MTRLPPPPPGSTNVSHPSAFVMPKAMLVYSDWIPDEATETEWERMAKWYGRPLTVRERLMCIPYDVLTRICQQARMDGHRVDVVDVVLMKLAHAREQYRRLSVEKP